MRLSLRYESTVMKKLCTIRHKMCTIRHKMCDVSYKLESVNKILDRYHIHLIFRPIGVLNGLTEKNKFEVRVVPFAVARVT